MNKHQPPFIRSEYNYDMAAASNETAIDTGTEGGAKQSFKDECDINTIIKRHGLGYELPENPSVPQYGDFDGITDYHSAMNATAKAREQFDQLPADLRSRFENDTAKFVDFCLDPANIQELRKMRLLNQEALDRLDMADQEAEKARQEAEKLKGQGGGIGA